MKDKLLALFSWCLLGLLCSTGRGAAIHSTPDRCAAIFASADNQPSYANLKNVWPHASEEPSDQLANHQIAIFTGLKLSDDQRSRLFRFIQQQTQKPELNRFGFKNTIAIFFDRDRQVLDEHLDFDLLAALRTYANRMANLVHADLGAANLVLRIETEGEQANGPIVFSKSFVRSVAITVLGGSGVGFDHQIDGSKYHIQVPPYETVVFSPIPQRLIVLPVPSNKPRIFMGLSFQGDSLYQGPPKKPETPSPNGKRPRVQI